MSNPFGLGSTAFAIHADTENHVNPAMRKTKAGEIQGKPPATKRAALGVITNQTRAKPLRSAKQVKNKTFIGKEGRTAHINNHLYCRTFIL